MEIKGFLDGLKPIKRLSVWQWADENRYLSAVAASEPGLWRTDRTPYLREPMEVLSSYSAVQTIIIMKGAQLGFTELGNNWIGYIIDNNPGPTLMVMPTEDTMKTNSKLRIDTMIEASPALGKKIVPASKRRSGNTTMQKDFPSGVLKMVGANSPVGLRSMPMRNVFMDEIDEYPADLAGQGSPIALAEARTRTFANRKKLLVSTPTIEGRSLIDAEYQRTDQRKFFVPCPFCGHKQHLRFEQMRWEQGKPETARYECESCAGHIEERHKIQMLKGGEWRATRPENANPIEVGYHISSLYSPYGWFSWADVVAFFEKAEKDPTYMKTFVNTVLGETYKSSDGDTPAWDMLYAKRENYPIGTCPQGVCFITVGVDVQADRLELEIVGWGKEKESWSIEYLVLSGRTSEREVWDELAQIVNKSWEREDNTLIPMGLMAVDTGFNTQHVYDFCRRFDRSRVIPVKGMDSLNVVISTPSTVDVASAGKKIGSLQVWPVGSSLLKSETYGFLKQQINVETGEIPYGYCHFPQYAPNFFKGLASEELQTKRMKNGHVKYQWVKTYQRNEPLDCRNYARAAAEVVGISRMKSEDFDRLTQAYIRRATVVEMQRPEKQRRVRSSNLF